jgi:hypothetical protein
MVIVFIVDTNKSMAQECHTNFSFLDVAKCAIDHFLICKPETNNVALIESSELSRLHHALTGPNTAAAVLTATVCVDVCARVLMHVYVWQRTMTRA